MYVLFGSRFATRCALLGLAGLFLVPAAARAQNYGGKGALLGGLGGAAAGAIIGNNNGKKAGTGAAIGAGVGALSGLLVGKAVESEVEKKQAQAAYQASQQTAAAYEQRALQVRAGGVTPEDVISMTRAGLSEDVMTGQIRSSGISRQLQVNDLIYLRNQGVPDGVIRTLQSTQVASGGTVNYTPASYGVQQQPTIIEQAPPPVVVVERVPVYRPYPYYYGPAWCPPPYHHHHHSHYHRPSSGVSWGISVGGH